MKITNVFTVYVCSHNLYYIYTYTVSVEERIDVEANYISPLLRPDTTMTVRWSPENIVRLPNLEPEEIMVSVSMYEVDLERGSLSEMAILARNIPNDGLAELTLPRMTPQAGEEQVCAVVVRVEATGLRDMQVTQPPTDPTTTTAPSIDPSLLLRLLSATPIGSWGAIVYYTTSAILRNLCEDWCASEPEGIGEEILARLPPCPPTVAQARNDAVFIEDTGAGSFLNNIFHPAADTCFRQQVFTP